LANPSNHQLERHIRQSAADSSNVAFVKHALDQMRARHVNHAMVMEVLRMGHMYSQPEPDIRFTGLKCRMEQFVSGINVAVVVALEQRRSASRLGRATGSLVMLSFCLRPAWTVRCPGIRQSQCA